VVAFAALVDRPLAALAARGDRGISRPRDLEGRTVGVSGLPSDPAFVEAVVADDGGDPSAVEQVTIGFTAVTRLLSGRIDAAPVFWNAEGVVLRRRGLDIREFRVDDYGAPRYPELVLIARPERVDELEPAVEAIADGIETARADPQAAAERIAEAEGTGDVALVRAQVDAISGAWDPALHRSVLEAWAAFDARIGIVEAAPDVESAFDLTLSP
jgi:NitT/TauT family transport system substrate-binding protein/putative hydroxymethylpyrimidine transport system substrate-binding protein